ncbi:MAG: ribonuclease [Solirubrobacteraceae bacterium]|nr:ribonuclease [Solirubrobacteraceae bacterium]
MAPRSTEALAAAARAGGRLAIDTEFMTEGRYRPLLCLVQIAVPAPDGEGVEVEVLDPFVPLDPGPLAAALADPGIEVVVHAGRQDVAILRREWETEVTSLFDTQVAAGFAGYGAQVGYVNLLGETLEVSLPKSAGFTRWEQRPLTDEQLSYARGDVLHLLALADFLGARLDEGGRRAWVRDECRALEHSSVERDPDEVWRRLPRVNQLSGRARAVARELAAWRERTAAEEDKPVGSIVADAALIELARRQPRDEAGLERIRGLHQRGLRRRGAALIATIERGREAEPPALDDDRPAPPDPADAPVIALAEALVRQRALEAGLAYEVLAAKADIARVVGAVRRGEPEPDVRTITGWRRGVVGAELLALLRGEHLLCVERGPRVVVRPQDAA